MFGGGLFKSGILNLWGFPLKLALGLGENGLWPPNPAPKSLLPLNLGAFPLNCWNAAC